MYGNRKRGAAQVMPDDCLQNLIDHPWWIQDDSKTPQCGRLLRAFVPHVDLTPYTLIPENRSNPTEHHRALFKLEQLRIQQHRSQSQLPVAALPQYPGEVYAVHRAKVRPAIVVACDWSYPRHSPSKPKWQTSRTVLVAPYYGIGATNQRAGWNPEFVKRIRHCEYPQYLWDCLPLAGDTKDSILRLDHTMPIGLHHDSYQWTPHCLSEEALSVFREWIEWAFFGTLDEHGTLVVIRTELAELDGV